MESGKTKIRNKFFNAIKRNKNIGEESLMGETILVDLFQYWCTFVTPKYNKNQRTESPFTFLNKRLVYLYYTA